MGRKSKKRRQQQQQAHSSLQSLKSLGKGLGSDARDTLSRLATTVRAETPTLSLGSVKLGGALNSLYKSPIEPPSHATRLSSFAAKLNPINQVRSAFRRASTNRKLAQISTEMTRGGYSMRPVRRSRLPYVMAFFVALIGFGGWYVYQSIDLPDMPLAAIEKHLDYKNWLAAVGGYGQDEASEEKRPTETKAHATPRVQTSPGAAGSSSRYTSIATSGTSSTTSKYRGKGMTVRSSIKDTKGTRSTKGSTLTSRGAASTKGKVKYASSKTSRYGKKAYSSSKTVRSGSKVASHRGKSSKAKLVTSSRSAKSAKAKSKVVRTGYRRR